MPDDETTTGPQAYVQVSTATGSLEEAERVAAAVVDGRLAACAQVIGPVRSRYWWRGKVEAAQEWWCVVKTTRSRYDDVEAAIRFAHSYDVPEILAVPVVAGNREYLEWVSVEVGSTR